jgi:hypothetical protein
VQHLFWLRLQEALDTVNPESIRRVRLKFCEHTAQSGKATYDLSVPPVVHWDGNSLPDITGSEQVDRLPVLESGLHVEQLLGVPKLPNATGEATSNDVVTVVPCALAQLPINTGR